MSLPARIKAADVLRVEISDDDRQATFRFIDDNGAEFCVELPVCRLGELVAGIPNELSPTHPGNQSTQIAHVVCSWSIGTGIGSRDLALTLVTDEGRVVRFAMTPGQIAGIATISQYTRPMVLPLRVVN